MDRLLNYLPLCLSVGHELTENDKCGSAKI